MGQDLFLLFDSELFISSLYLFSKEIFSRLYFVIYIVGRSTHANTIGLI